MLEIKKYHSAHRAEWDEFVLSSRNGTFLFHRAYMEYHSDRFSDLSFLFYFKGKLRAILPGNIDETNYYSHQGLTYGGLILCEKTTMRQVLDIFVALREHLESYGLTRWIYKPVPHIYHRLPCEEDLYALFRLNALQIGCHFSSTIATKQLIRFTELRRKGIRKAERAALFLPEQSDLVAFWEILTRNLSEKYATQPVHTLSEMNYLRQTFPENILLHTVASEEEVLAGVVIYLCDQVAHVQYISASERGKQLGALDYLFSTLILERYSAVEYFDFGSSTENMGFMLNEALLFQKEGFGGRGIIYPIYELQIGAEKTT